MLTPNDLDRYARQISLPDFGPEGQKRIAECSVLVVGAGGLASPVCMYLVAAGVGLMGIIDDDVVALSNLQRQLLYGEADVGSEKVVAAKRNLGAINSECEITVFPERLTNRNAERLIRNFDLVVDTTDNLATRYAINDTCCELGKPFVYGSVYQLEGQVSVFDSTKGPCYRCLYPEEPPPDVVPSCEEGGVLGVLPGIVGCIQATESLKIVCGIGEPLVGTLLHIDPMSWSVEKFLIEKNPACASCGPVRISNRATDYLIMATELQSALDNDAVFLVDVRTSAERNADSIGGIHIPLNELEDRWPGISIPKDKTVAFYCATGVRSLAAVNTVLGLGSTKALSLEGGLRALNKIRRS